MINAPLSAVSSQLLTRREAARLLRVSVVTLGRWTRSRKMNLPHARIGGRVLYPAAGLAAFIRRQTSEPELIDSVR